MGDLVGDCAGADFDLVFAGFVAARAVDDEGYFSVLHHVDDVWSLVFSELVNALDCDALFLEELVGAACGVDCET